MKPGKADIIVGLDYGDEGKGRITDGKLQSGDYQIVTRFNGGNNAGHTLVPAPGKKLILNSIPSGILYSDVTNYIGSGCVVDPVNLIENEFRLLKDHLELTPERLKISALATAITPAHILWDRISGGMVGTTGKGIGPAYTAKARRAENGLVKNLRLGDILANPKLAAEVIKLNYQEIFDFLEDKKHLKIMSQFSARYGITNHYDFQYFKDTHAPREIDQFIKSVQELAQRGFIEKDPLWLTSEVENGKNVLMEGAQAFGLDITYGTTPYTTSSNTFSGAAYVGGDLAPSHHGKIFGVTKAIASRVGSGPFVGEFGGKESEEYCDQKLGDGSPAVNREKENSLPINQLLESSSPFEFGIALRSKTEEYGATTGRPRRIAMMDLHRLSTASRLSGVDELYITKVDSLTHYTRNRLFEGKIPLITGYELNGQEINHTPSNAQELYEVQTKLSFIPAIPDISQIRSAENLPEAVIQLVDLVQKFTKTKVAAIGVGPGREEMVYLK